MPNDVLPAGPSKKGAAAAKKKATKASPAAKSRGKKAAAPPAPSAAVQEAKGAPKGQDKEGESVYCSNCFVLNLASRPCTFDRKCTYQVNIAHP